MSNLTPEEQAAKNDRFRAAYGGRTWDGLSQQEKAEVVAFDSVSSQPQSRLQEMRDKFYDAKGRAFEETFPKWAHRVSAGYAVPVMLFFIGAAIIVVAIVASR